MTRTARVVTASNRAAAGVYADKTGPLIVAWLRDRGYTVPDAQVVPDGAPVESALRAAVAAEVDVVVTTGGTGVTPTDRTPEATRAVLDYEIPGLADAIRAAGLPKVPTAALSRGLAGVAGRTLVVNLPGSTGGVKDGLAVLSDVLDHAVDQLRGGDHPPSPEQAQPQPSRPADEAPGPEQPQVSRSADQASEPAQPQVSRSADHPSSPDPAQPGAVASQAAGQAPASASDLSTSPRSPADPVDSSAGAAEGSRTEASDPRFAMDGPAESGPAGVAWASAAEGRAENAVGVTPAEVPRAASEGPAGSGASGLARVSPGDVSGSRGEAEGHAESGSAGSARVSSTEVSRSRAGVEGHAASGGARVSGAEAAGPPGGEGPSASVENGGVARVLRAEVSDAPIDVESHAALVENAAAGAVVTFAGVVRDHDHGRGVTALDYEGHPSAGEVIAEVAGDIAVRHPGVRALAVSHRVGALAIGDVALACAVSADHRRAAFDACADLVDEVKARLPIWKHQVFTDGTDEWVNCP
ncbi:Molybdopterin adenylyltransferase [Actinokineospora sp. UTMC 2448]|nr:Molybdopterin adenylyltransferase [Actinokineospora sp. UTMC 2448]